jgi:hypothetical protein
VSEFPRIKSPVGKKIALRFLVKKITLLFIISILGCFLLSSASAGDLNSLFSKQYDRTKGKPNVYSDTFEALPGQALLLVENGLGDNSGTRISSAEIWLNGTKLFKNSDFNKKKQATGSKGRNWKQGSIWRR